MKRKFLPAHFDIAPDCRPTADQELLLRAALSPLGEAVEAWLRWVAATGGVDRRHAPSDRMELLRWYDIVGGISRPDSASLWIMPLLYRKLSSHGHDDDQLRVLKGIYRDSWRVNQLLLHSASKLLGRFADAGIPTIVLKGPALIELYYGDVGVRPMSDVDILVPAEQAQEACRLLSSAGWTEKTGAPLTSLRVTRHAATFVGEGGREVDLHWSATHLPVSDDALWAAAQPVQIHGAPTLALSDTDQLMHVVVHGTGPAGAPVRWVADAITVLENARGQIAWDRLSDQATAAGMTLRLLSGLTYLERTFHAAVPDTALARLRASTVTMSEWLSHLVLTHPPRHGESYVHTWERWRRVRALDPPGVRPANYFQYLQWEWNLTSQRQLARRLIHKIGQIVRTGHSDPGLVLPSALEGDACQSSPSSVADATAR